MFLIKAFCRVRLQITCNPRLMFLITATWRARLQIPCKTEYRIHVIPGEREAGQERLAWGVVHCAPGGFLTSFFLDRTKKQVDFLWIFRTQWIWRNGGSGHSWSKTRWKRPFLQHLEMWSCPVLLTHIFTWTGPWNTLLVHKMCIQKSVKKKWKRLLVSWIMCWTHFWKCNFKINVDLQETFTYTG